MKSIHRKLPLLKLNLRSVKNKLILAFVVILLLPSLTIGWISYTTAKNNVDEQFQQTAFENVNLLNQTITQMMQGTMNDVDFLAQQISVGSIGSTQGEEAAKVRKMLEVYKQFHPEVRNIIVGTETGAIIRPSDSAPLPSDYDPRKRSWYKNTMENKGKIVVSDPEISSSTKVVEVTISKVVSDGHGVVGLDLRLEALSDIVNKINIGKEGYAVLYDAKRKYLVHPSAKIGDTATGPTTDKIFGSDSDVFEYINGFDGRAKKLVFATNPLTGWKLAGTWYSDEITQVAAPIFNNTLLVIAVALLTGTVIVFFITRSIVTPLHVLADASRKISEGDLRYRADIKSKDEFGELGVSFNLMKENLRDIIRQAGYSAEQVAASSEQLTASAEQTSKAAEQIASTIQEVAAGSEQQVRSIDESAKTINEMSAGAQQIAANAQSASSAAMQASEIALEGNQAIQTAVSQMNSISRTVNGLATAVKGLGERSHQIGQIVEVITNIAAQTNLLALNAAIEAARAGEHGRGFSVVADEVRKLAEQSAESAQQIAEMIASIQVETNSAVQTMETATKEVNDGIQVVTRAGESFTEIQRSVNEVASQIEEVSASSEQMSAGTEQVVNAIQVIAEAAESAAAGTQNVSAATEEQTASMEEITASTSALSKMAEELQAIVGRFKV